MRPSAMSSTIQSFSPEKGSVPDVAARETLATVPRTPPLGFADRTGAFGVADFVSVFVAPSTPPLGCVEGVAAVFELLAVVELTAAFELTGVFELTGGFELQALFDAETAYRVDCELLGVGAPAFSFC